jgi:hypothetical protein
MSVFLSLGINHQCRDRVLFRRPDYSTFNAVSIHLKANCTDVRPLIRPNEKPCMKYKNRRIAISQCLDIYRPLSLQLKGPPKLAAA